MHGDTGLTNLAVVVNEACINSCTACTNLAMQFLGQFEQHVETFLAAYAVASGHHDGGTLEVVLGLFHMAVDDLDDIIGGGHIFGHISIYHFSLVVFVDHFALHHTFAHGGHLGPVVGIDDGSHDVASECGANLVEQVLIVCARLLVVVVADFQLSAVGGKTAGER